MTTRPHFAPVLAAWLFVTAGAVGAAAQPAGASSATALDRPPAMTQARGGRAAATPQMIAARKAMRQACTVDIAKFCADVEKGHGGLMKCLRAHAADVAPTCRQAGQAMRAARSANPG